VTAPDSAVRFLDPVNPVELRDAVARLLHTLRPRVEPIPHHDYPDLGGTWQWWIPEGVHAGGSWGFTVNAGLERNLAEYDSSCRPDGVWPGEAFIEVNTRITDTGGGWSGSTSILAHIVIGAWAAERGCRTLIQSVLNPDGWLDPPASVETPARAVLLDAMNDLSWSPLAVVP